MCNYYGSIHSIQSFRNVDDKSYGILLPLSRVDDDDGAGDSVGNGSLPLQKRDVIVDPSDITLYKDIPARYINDPRSSSHYNVVFKPALQELCAHVVALRDIRENEELFIDYGEIYWANQDYEPNSLHKSFC